MDYSFNSILSASGSLLISIPFSCIGTDLVKTVAFHPTDSKNLGSDIFHRLVPMRAYEASSIYSESKADLVRSINSSVNEKDEELE